MFMTISQVINLFAGLMIMIGLLLAHLSASVDMTEMSWLWLVAFVGFNLFQFSITGFCPLDKILRKMGFKDSAESACGAGGCGSH
jgi:hypothetical protein